jgi:hypothetical protein
MSKNKTVFIATRFGSVKETTMFGFACNGKHVTTSIGNQRSENVFTSKFTAQTLATKWAKSGTKRIQFIQLENTYQDRGLE